MADFVMWYRVGGWGMHLVLLMNLFAVAGVPLALLLAIVARATGKMGGVARVAAILGTMLAAAPCCAGIVGYNSAMWKTESVLENADPERKSMLLTLGGEEASHNLNFGVGSALCMLLPAVLAFLIAPSKPPPPEPEY
ncbi:MAG: hypothetical protein EXR71_00340 [Myxococcales bacterium]|nr:hypothetical protein [Myxococcales bacterium]